MADLQVQRRRNPKTGRMEDYRALRWVDPVTLKRHSQALGFVSLKEATQIQKVKEAELLLLSRAASGSPAVGSTPISGRAPLPSPGDAWETPTLRDWLEAHYLPIFKLDHAAATNRQEVLAASWLAELLGHVRIGDLKNMHVERYKAHRVSVSGERTGRPPSPTTVNIELRVLASALRNAQELGVLQTPLPKIKRLAAKKKPVRYLTADEVERLLAASRPRPDDNGRDPGTWLALLLMANLGLRKGEALTREWSDIDLDQGVVRVTHKPAIDWYVKGGRARRGRERVIPMTPVVRDALSEARMAAGRPDSGWVFPAGRQGDKEGPRKEIMRGIQGAAKRAKLRVHVHPHLLRHAWASRLAMDGVDRKSLQEMGGWIDGRMLDEVYAHVTPKHLKAIMDQQGIGELKEGVVVEMRGDAANMS